MEKDNERNFGKAEREWQYKSKEKYTYILKVKCMQVAVVFNNADNFAQWEWKEGVERSDFPFRSCERRALHINNFEWSK